jgi:hypothetical protein
MTKIFAIGCSSLLIFCSGVLFTETLAWDSADWNPTNPTHTFITDWAINAVKTDFPEVTMFRVALVEGANTELHELPSDDDYHKKLAQIYKIDLDMKRRYHKGTNAGCNDIKGWWEDAFRAYGPGNEQKKQAYFILGIMLHMVEDMGVPAHANGVHHQGNVGEFDNFEAISALNWCGPSTAGFNDIDKHDPKFSEPWLYYSFSQDWASKDAPNYHDRDAFPKFWITATEAERKLVSNRQGRTCRVTAWALKSAMKRFEKK